MSTVIPVILSGGSGSRLWPKSREHYPKQLHRLYGEHTMLQHTLLRVQHLDSKPIVICNNDQRFMVAEQIQELGIEAEIILEPVARNTAPAIAVAAIKSLEVDQNAIIAVFPADHLVKGQKEFEASLALAAETAAKGKLVTFGVKPLKPETGYGYIKADFSVAGAVPVEQFVEKPDLATAKSYLQSEQYYWNSGMFVFNAALLIEELNEFQPGLIACCEAALVKSTKDLDFCRLEEQSFSAATSVSIDYAVMERTTKAYVVKFESSWSDVGSWDALWDVSDKDDSGNVLSGDVLIENTKNCYLNSGERHVAAVGVEDLVVVETADAVLIAKRDDTQSVKKLVERLKQGERKEATHHKKVYRPWGSAELLEEGERFQVRSIELKPGESMSMQKHFHRAEHWVVVAGTGELNRGDDSLQTISENESVYVHAGEKHKLINPGKIRLKLVEIASGSYLEDDDIVRFD